MLRNFFFFQEYAKILAREKTKKNAKKRHIEYGRHLEFPRKKLFHKS
jgi:hypothetical protein